MLMGLRENVRLCVCVCVLVCVLFAAFDWWSVSSVVNFGEGQSLYACRYVRSLLHLIGRACHHWSVKGGACVFVCVCVCALCCVLIDGACRQWRVEFVCVSVD